MDDRRGRNRVRTEKRRCKGDRKSPRRLQCASYLYRDHRKRCKECRKRYFLRKLSLKSSHFSSNRTTFSRRCRLICKGGGKRKKYDTPIVKLEEINFLAELIAEHQVDGVPKWLKISQIFFDKGRPTSKKMRRLRNAWQRNYCGLKDLSVDYIQEKSQGAKSSRGAVGSKRKDEQGTDQLPDTFSVSSSESSSSEDYEPRSKKKKQESSVSLSSFVGVAMAAFLRENDESPMDTFKSIGRLFESTNKRISVKPVLTNDKNEPVSPETSPQALETKEERKRESEEEEHHDIEEQESLKNCFEQCDDEGHDIFEQLGTSAKTIGMMTSSKVPKTGLFHASSWKEIINVNLSSDVLMNEIEDKCEYRRFNDKGMATIMSILEKTNPHCCLAVKKNRIKKVGSRKINIRFWSGRAVCTFTTCKCFAELNIQNQQNPVLEIIWKNNIVII